MSKRDFSWRGAAELAAGTIDSLIEIVGPEVFASLKAEFVADLRGQCAAYHRARAAGDDALACASAHALRGAALNIGLSRLGMLAGALEQGDRADETELDEVLENSLARLIAAG